MNIILYFEKAFILIIVCKISKNDVTFSVVLLSFLIPNLARFKVDKLQKPRKKRNNKILLNKKKVKILKENEF
jgi:hypothetical protein